MLSRKQIVEHVCIHIKEGEFVGVIGPNGSGKSTLLKAICRIIEPSGGSVAIDGSDIKRISLRDSALKAAVVLQHNHFNFDFKAKDVVMMGRSPHKKAMELDNKYDHEVVDESIRMVGMEDFAERSFHTLSGGEQQRIVLARSLSQQTPCLLLDEPTNHLDIKYQLHLLDIVKNIGLTVFCAMHDLNLAASYCDRLYLMKEGRIHSFGTPEEILTEETIKEVYGVDASVEKNKKTGLLNVVYYPGQMMSKDDCRVLIKTS